MRKSYRLIIFDWEGTLSDTLGQILSCVALEAKRLNFGELDEQLARQSVALGLINTIKKVFPKLNNAELNKLIDAVQQALLTRSNDVYLISGAKNILQRLQRAGISLAIATNKSAQGLQRALCAAKFDTFFQITRSAGILPAKPCSQMLKEILDFFKLPASAAVMVGDSIVDIEMANSIGMDAIGVNFYHQENGALLAAGALEVFNDYQLFADYLQLPK
jgi:phosphoglycolate phosphatase